MRYAAPLLLAILQNPPPTPEELFQKCQDAVLRGPFSCKIQGTLEFQFPARSEAHAIRHEFLIKPPRRFLHFSRMQEKRRNAPALRQYAVSDGRHLRTLRELLNDEGDIEIKQKRKDAPEKVDVPRRVALLLIRCGTLGFFFAPIGWMDDPKADLEKMIRLSDFSRAENERVGDRDCLVLEYTATLSESNDSAASSTVWRYRVWLDPETFLPRKRAIRLTDKPAGSKYVEAEIEENFTEFRQADIPDDQFVPPRLEDEPSGGK